jgi:DNA-binding transcriptional regulator LsrR (DeoR family)
LSKKRLNADQAEERMAEIRYYYYTRKLPKVEIAVLMDITVQWLNKLLKEEEIEVHPARGRVGRCTKKVFSFMIPLIQEKKATGAPSYREIALKIAAYMKWEVVPAEKTVKNWASTMGNAAHNRPWQE